ncbi:uncharacterized protein [Amphiura filiformis]|uniref:uncharacterized protein n=1 Tax=Amphiura filiformis TaxID=82378 RepID=UPI003B20C98F
MASCNRLKFGIYNTLPDSKYKSQRRQWNDINTLLWTALLTLILLPTVYAQCKKVNNCRCKLPNGKLIDISKIGNKDGTEPKFPYSLPDDGSALFYEYSFNGCYAYSDAFCKDAVACQRRKNSQDPGFSLGTPDSADYTDGTVLNFTAVGQDGQQRTARIKLICEADGTPESSSIKRLGEPAANWIYEYELTSKCACGNGCASPDTGLSIGSLLCILFPVAVILYLVLGGIFMKFVRGAEGKEVIPNVSIWMEFPMLVKDGAMFVVNLVKPGAGKSGYDTDI